MQLIGIGKSLDYSSGAEGFVCHSAVDRKIQFVNVMRWMGNAGAFHGDGTLNLTMLALFEARRTAKSLVDTRSLAFCAYNLSVFYD